MSTINRLPLLDLSHLHGNPEQRRAFLTSLNEAARNVGFFYLTHHSIPETLQQQARAFFALPDDEKQRVAMIHSPHFRGYNRAGAELTRNQPDWREQFDIGAERAAL